MCCLSFRNRSDLCSIPYNVRTADSFDKGRFPWSQVICTPVPHKGYLVRGEILATQNLPNVQNKTKYNIKIRLKSRCQVPSSDIERSQFPSTQRTRSAANVKRSKAKFIRISYHVTVTMSNNNNEPYQFLFSSIWFTNVIRNHINSLNILYICTNTILVLAFVVPA